MSWPISFSLVLARWPCNLQGPSHRPEHIRRKWMEQKSRYTKTVGDVRLKLYVFDPPHRSIVDKRPAIVFFFGSGWRGGTPQQFEQQCRYLASRGMVAITADYRVSSRNEVKVPEIVQDAKSAMRWVRQNASRLGIDPSRIAAGGGSAGGHIAAAASVIASLDESNEDSTISSRPNALVLFNPAVVLPPIPDSEVSDLESWRKIEERLRTMPELTGVDTAAISPYLTLQKVRRPPSFFMERPTGRFRTSRLSYLRRR